MNSIFKTTIFGSLILASINLWADSTNYHNPMTDNSEQFLRELSLQKVDETDVFVTYEFTGEVQLVTGGTFINDLICMSRGHESAAQTSGGSIDYEQAVELSLDYLDEDGESLPKSQAVRNGSTGEISYRQPIEIDNFYQSGNPTSARGTTFYIGRSGGLFSSRKKPTLEIKQRIFNRSGLTQIPFSLGSITCVKSQQELNASQGQEEGESQKVAN